MIELVIVSRLLEYPDAALWQHQQELFDAIAASEKLAPEDAHKLSVFLRDLTAQDVLDAQSRYSELFAAARPRCCCLSTCTANPAIAARRWLT